MVRRRPPLPPNVLGGFFWRVMMRINDIKLIRLIDVDITSKYCGMVRIKVASAALSNKSNCVNHNEDMQFCLTKKQTTQLIKMLKAQRDRIK